VITVYRRVDRSLQEKERISVCDKERSGRLSTSRKLLKEWYGKTDESQ
jgi:hypothetical protein